MEHNENRTLRVVAFGASAGGLQALQPIIKSLEAQGRAAYIVAHHMGPRQASNLATILADHASLAVVVASDGAPVLADHVYVCPPGCDIEIVDDRLCLPPSAEGTLISPSIDRLFRSVAVCCGPESVGVILSGSGHDGSHGAMEINAAGGTVLVQMPEEAMQPAMPEAAIENGCADLVGNAKQIAAWLNAFERPEQRQTMARGDAGDRAFAELLSSVSEATGIDALKYKENTLRRQTVRRYRALGMNSIEQYLDHVRRHGDELHLLQQSFMISVSSFFRDPSTFDSLADVLRPMLARKRPNDSVRIWIPGCATGEEAYSIAILIAEILGDRLPQLDVRIFATDVDEVAIGFARIGLYPDAALESVAGERRNRWFDADPGGWRIGKTIRSMCVFSLHDVISHPPFIRMDLISCRNLLIYFKSEQQTELIGTFHYGLNSGGVLLLGKSESTGFQADLFEPIDPHHKIFRRRTGAATHARRYARPGAMLHIRQPLLSRVAQTPLRQSLVDSTLGLIAREYGPPSVLVNSGFEPLHFFGRSQRFFSITEDAADFSIFALCQEALRSELKALCFRLVQDGLSRIVGTPVRLSVNGEDLSIRPAVMRIERNAEAGDGAFVICFDPVDARPEAPGQVVEAGSAESAEVIRLRRDLGDTREHLQAVIEELETTNEELQSLNEEVQSSSEELQASNEELQASNEELTTVNDELRLKSQEAMELTTVLGNIQNSIRSGLVMVDRDGRISRYNPMAVRIFGLVANDIGQFLYGVPCHLHLPRLREQVSGVIATGISVVERVHHGEFHFLMQIDPYRDEHGESAGAVLTFADISELTVAEEAQQSSEMRFRQVWEASLDGLIVVDGAGIITLANPALESTFAYPPGELIGQAIELLVPERLRDLHVGLRQTFTRQSPAQRLVPTRDLIGRRKDGSEFFIELSLSSMSVGGKDFVLATVNDITKRKQAEAALRESADRLRLALDAAHAGTWVWYVNTNENVWTDEVWALYGLEAGDRKPSFETWRDTVAAGDRDRVLATVADAAARLAEFETEWQVNMPAGVASRWLMSRGRPITGPDGKLSHYIGIVIDISERKRAELELAQHRDALESLVEKRTAQLSELYNRAPCGYHTLNRNGEFVSVNDTELEWLGYTREEMLGGMRAPDIMAPHCREVFAANFPKLKASGELNGLEFDFVRKDGSLLPIMLNARAVYDENGAFMHSLATIIDNTDRKRAESAWLAAREAAESANLAKSAFLANMSHEIRTPMTAIIGMAELMARDAPTPKQAERLEKMNGAAHHLLEIINNILDLSKIEAGKMVLDDASVDPASIVADVATMLADRATEKGLSLTTECTEARCELRGDPTRIRQALLNYASNAIKFTATGRIILRTTIAHEDMDCIVLRFEVQDSGVGISREALSRLFSKFEQLDNSPTRQFGGTGLGLAIVRQLAGLMGGEAGVDSEQGVGSRFWFTVRLRKAETARPGLAANLPAAPGGPHGRGITGRRILVVDDEPLNQEVITAMLEADGPLIEIASNGEEAVARAAQAGFDLILMDMNMPRMDGLEATRRIRKLPGFATVPIIALTGNVIAEVQGECTAAGIDDFIAKPFRMDELLAAVTHWLGVARPD